MATLCVGAHIIISPTGCGNFSAFTIFADAYAAHSCNKCTDQQLKICAHVVAYDQLATPSEYRTLHCILYGAKALRPQNISLKPQTRCSYKCKQDTIAEQKWETKQTATTTTTKYVFLLLIPPISATTTCSPHLSAMLARVANFRLVLCVCFNVLCKCFDRVTECVFLYVRVCVCLPLNNQPGQLLKCKHA